MPTLADRPIKIKELKTTQKAETRLLWKKATICEELEITPAQFRYFRELEENPIPVIKIGGETRGRLFADPKRLKAWIDALYNEQHELTNPPI